MKRVAILQSNYLPWKGYFDIAAAVDLFIFHDDLQYTKNDWRNRNLIKTSGGLKWLTIPCGTSEKRLICEVTLDASDWQMKHWRQIEAAYHAAPFFGEFAPYFKDIFLKNVWRSLSELNQRLIRDIAQFLAIDCRFDDSRAYHLQHRKAKRVLELLQKTGAASYLSGPAAKKYLNQDDFEQAGIELRWADYSGYPEYPQLYPPFRHEVSIIDLLFNTGSAARNYLKNKGGDVNAC